jgi:voltage-gated potassium channel
MVSFVLMLALFYRFIRHMLRLEEFRALLVLVLLYLCLGTVFYRFTEGWRWLDAFYFTLITLATIGYGDFTPQTDRGKIFTILYILIGLGLVGALIGIISIGARENLEKHAHHLPRRRFHNRRRARRGTTQGATDEQRTRG